MFLTRVTPATALPVSIVDVRAHLRVCHTDEDSVLYGYIAAACATVAEMTGRSLAVETWRMDLPCASGDVKLPRAPVQAVTGISYYAPDGTDTAAVVSDFHLFKDEDRAILRPKDGKAWPGVQAREDAIRITFTVGYTVLPDQLKQAVMLLVGHWDMQRAAAGEANMAEIPFGVEALVAQFRLGWVAA